jgi:transcriptional repressor NF-X1
MSQLASGCSINLEQLTELKSVKLSDRKLECDEICKMEERNRKLREALDIQDAVVSPLLEKPNYTDFLCQMAKSVSDSAFTQQVEETVRQLVMVALKKSTPQNHPFPPANRRRRQGIHELAEAYGCDSQSFDDEPKRNVTVYTTRRSYLPSVPLMKYIHQKPSCQPRPANLDSIMLSRQKDPPLKTSVDYFEGDY